MASNECTPFYKPGDDLTGHATAAVTGKRFLKISGNRASGPGLTTAVDGSNYSVAPAGAGEASCGVAKYDAASGSKVAVATAGIVPVLAGANITAWAEVMADAAGKAIPYVAGSGVFPLGRAMTGATSGADAEIKLYQ